MAVSKVVYGGNTLIDLTGDTVAADKLLSGYTAHDAAGNAITGTASSGGGLPAEIVAGDTPVLMNPSVASASSSSNMVATGVSITISKAGTYRVHFILSGGNTGSTSYQPSAQIYKNGTATGSIVINTGNPSSTLGTEDIECASGDVLEVYLKGYSYWGHTIGSVGMLVACIDWDNGF